MRGSQMMCRWSLRGADNGSGIAEGWEIELPPLGSKLDEVK